MGPVYASAANFTGTGEMVPADIRGTRPEWLGLEGAAGGTPTRSQGKEVSIKVLERLNHPAFKWPAVLCVFLTVASGGLDGRGTRLPVHVAPT